jgi:hypothetical protein
LEKKKMFYVDYAVNQRLCLSKRNFINLSERYRFMDHESELGRQTAISIPQKKGMITVAIQEFTEEGTVNITFMAVGS